MSSESEQSRLNSARDASAEAAHAGDAAGGGVDAAVDSSRDAIPRGCMYPIRLRRMVEMIQAMGLPASPKMSIRFYRRVYPPARAGLGWGRAMQLFDASHQSPISARLETIDPTSPWIGVFSLPTKAAREAGLTHERVEELVTPGLRLIAQPLTHGQWRRMSCLFLPDARRVDWEVRQFTYGETIILAREQISVM